MIEIKRSGSQQSSKGPAEFFIGNVRLDPLVNTEDPARVQVLSVTFEPGSRTAWHTHPLGQTLIVTSGCGLVQAFGRTADVIRPGDVIWTPPGVKHWHGAIDSASMTHIAVVEKLNGKAVDWMEHVSDEDYQSGCALCNTAKQGEQRCPMS